MKSRLYKIKDSIRDFKAQVAKLFWDNQKTPKNFDIKRDIKKILLMRFDGKIGDLVINSIIIKAIKNWNPEVEIYVLTSKSASELIKCNPKVKQIIHYENKKTPISEIKNIFKNISIDVVIDFSEFLRFNEIQLLNAVNGKYYIGYNKKDWRLFNDSIAPHDNSVHITERYKRLLNLIGVPLSDFQYEVFNCSTDQNLNDLIDSNKTNIFFNGYTAMRAKTLSEDKIKSLVTDILSSHENARVWFFPPSDKIETLCHLFKDEILKSRVYVHKESLNIRELYAAISKMHICVSADTSTIHLAAAAGIPIIGLYKNIDSSKSDGKMWLPITKNSHIIFSEKAIDNNEPDINTISNSAVIAKLNSLITS